ncbi:MAG: hypothetical protein IKM48_08150 [Clostridia bacterium]|nr:hypothetical protein [Clostridia bacterium]
MKSRVVCKNGNAMVEINGVTYPFAAARSFRPTPANVSLFYRNGLRLFQVQCGGIKNKLGVPYSLYGGCWVGDHTYDFTALDNQMEMFVRFAPEGYFMPMAILDMPEWWMERHQSEINSFWQPGEASLMEEWVEEACDYLKAFLRHAEEKWGDRVFAYSFSAGRTTEWFDAFGTTPRKVAAYGKTPVPTLEDLDRKLVYENDSPEYQYLKFCSTLVPKLIGRFTAAAREVVHCKPFGIFYGYCCMNVGYQNRIAGSGGYEEVWSNEGLDIIFSPALYGNNRLAEGVSSYQVAVDSLPLHGKIYLHEIDHRTHLARYPLENGTVLQCDYENAEETIRILRRELCATACKGGALWWFDFFGGYYADPAYEEELRRETAILDRLYRMKRQSVAEIAVFVEPTSFMHLCDKGELPLELVRYNKDSLHESGAPFDFYNLKDLPKIPKDQYKMFVFLNALDMTDAVKREIKDLKQTVVWLYAPNRFTGGCEEVCGIKLAPAKGGKILWKGEEFGFSDPETPRYAVADEEAEIIARYMDGTPACARKGREVYLAAGKVPPALFRALAKEAGVHIYTEDLGSLYVDSRFIAYQTTHTAEPELTLPFDCELEELFDGGTYRTQNKTLRYSAPKGETKLFLIKK